MEQVKAARAIILAACEESGIGDNVRKMEARLAQMFIQQPTEEDLASLATAFALVGMQAEALMANAHQKIKQGEHEPAPIEVQLQPTAEMIAAGLKECEENGLYMGDITEDLIVFVWQAMIGARNN